jgi:superfamily II DNA or RNA helicase
MKLVRKLAKQIKAYGEDNNAEADLVGIQLEGGLRDYQQEILDYLIQGGRQNWLVVMPTNTGKTRVFIEYTRWAQTSVWCRELVAGSHIYLFVIVLPENSTTRPAVIGNALEFMVRYIWHFSPPMVHEL